MTGHAAAARAAGRRTLAVIGGGPAGLMAAESLAADHDVTVFDRMPGVGRKFLMAGRGGLNLTHGEPRAGFVARYGDAVHRLAPIVADFPPEALRAWCEALGQPTFVGSSGRVFPVAMKASPLLRAWLRRLDALGVRWALGRRWVGWDERGAACFADAAGRIETRAADATILALGGASWPRLGADGGWVATLRAAGIAVADLAPSNCGALVAWTGHLVSAFAGAPLKRVALTAGGERVRGEAVITARGLEGGAVYALSGRLRAELAACGRARLTLDLRPDLGIDELAARLRAARRGARSLASFLRSAATLPPVAVALLREVHGRALPEDPAPLAAAIKSLQLQVAGLAPIERAISSAGGIAWEELDAGLMLTRRPGVFVCGEMIDWDAPTGGYLLQACFATARRAAEGVRAFLAATPSSQITATNCA
jgi:uncharacterized flavoprotein (TIGR03862 family)